MDKWLEIQKAIPLLLGLGLNEFSMSVSSILPARSQLKKINKKDMELLVEKTLLMKPADEVLKLLKKHLKQLFRF